MKIPYMHSAGQRNRAATIWSWKEKHQPVWLLYWVSFKIWQEYLGPFNLCLSRILLLQCELLITLTFNLVGTWSFFSCHFVFMYFSPPQLAMQHLCSDYLMLQFPSYSGGDPYISAMLPSLFHTGAISPEHERWWAYVLTPNSCFPLLNQAVL